jgi:hypothetical protein
MTALDFDEATALRSLRSYTTADVVERRRRARQALVLYNATHLTVVNAIWAPHMTLYR